MKRVLSGLTGAALALAAAGPAAADELVLYAAGSLREAMTQIARDFHARTGTTVRAEFGPSGVMRERIEKGERVDLLASAGMGHPLRLERQGQARAIAMFARNPICAFSTARVGLTASSLLDLLLDPGIKLGTTAAGTGPLGDCTLQLFKRADALRPGAASTLTAKARVLIGGANQPPAGQDMVATSLRDGTVDVFLAYCGGRSRLEGQVANLTVIALPDNLRVGPEYGVALLKGAPPQAAVLMLYILSPAGQATMAQHGFTPVTLPAP